MRILIIFLLLLAVTFSSISQKMPEDYFEQGIVAFVNKDYKKSIEENRFLITHYAKYRDNRSVYKNLGLAYLQSGYFDSAASVFQKLMSDTSSDNHRNEKHETGLLLAEVYKQWGKFDSALFYIYLSDTLNYYSSGCGNCSEGEMFRTTNRLIQVFEAKGDTLAVKNELLKLALFRLENSSFLMNKLKILLVKEGNIANLKREFRTACQHVLKDKKGKGLSSYLSYINFQNTKMYLGFAYEPTGDRSKFIRQSSFYKMLMALPEKPIKKKH